MICRAIALVTGIDRERTLVYVTVMDMMKMTVMHVIDVLAMFDGGMTTTFSVFVIVVFMCFAAHYCKYSFDVTDSGCLLN